MACSSCMKCPPTLLEACRLGAEFPQLCDLSGNGPAYGIAAREGVGHKTHRVKSFASLASKLDDDPIQYIVQAHVFDDNPNERDAPSRRLPASLDRR